MKTTFDWLRRRTATCLVLCMTLPLAGTATASPLPQAAQQPNTTPANPTSEAQAKTPTGNDPPAAPQPVTEISAEPSPHQSNQQAPVGTAVAPYEKTTAVTASRPAGAAIAPAKQKQRRSLLIKTGLLIGAGVAVGTIVALSKASPSQPH